ncbi:MAG: DNA recombination protein RmuC, partial [Ignavibacteria bacterium]|nr:DNA recombination protein RmuC [Ignavibacteria bacterium]
MTNVIDPLKEFLGDFRKKIEDTRKEDIQEITTLKGEIRSLQELNMRL